MDHARGWSTRAPSPATPARPQCDRSSDPASAPDDANGSENSTAASVDDPVEKYLQARGYQPDKAGFKIYTTLDPTAQKAAQKAVSDSLSGTQAPLEMGHRNRRGRTILRLAVLDNPHSHSRRL